MDIGAIIFWGVVLGVPIVAFYNLGGTEKEETSGEKVFFFIACVVIGIAFVAGILVLGS